MRADIHDGPELNTLQSEAGYIEQDRKAARSTEPLATYGPTIHPGHSPIFRDRSMTSKGFVLQWCSAIASALGVPEQGRVRSVD